MASTNKTTHYELSQFLGSDKPAWLTDYNSDMSKIDTGINTAQTTATGADGKADSANTAIGTIANLTTTAKTDLVAAINEVDANADTAQNTANTAANNASQANTNINKLADYLTLGTASALTFTSSVGSTSATSNYMSVHKNSTGSLAKIYGQISISGLEGRTGAMTVTTSDTGLRPSSAITFNGCGFARIESTSYHIFRQIPISYTLNTNGTITYEYGNLNDIYSMQLQFVACLLFITDFGDIPTPE